MGKEMSQSEMEEFLWNVVLEIKTQEDWDVAKNYVLSFNKMDYETKPFQEYLNILKKVPLENEIKEYCKN